jgi:hypothetical protein
VTWSAAVGAPRGSNTSSVSDTVSAAVPSLVSDSLIVRGAVFSPCFR